MADTPAASVFMMWQIPAAHFLFCLHLIFIAEVSFSFHGIKHDLRTCKLQSCPFFSPGRTPHARFSEVFITVLAVSNVKGCLHERTGVFELGWHIICE